MTAQASATQAIPDEATRYVCTNPKVKDLDGKTRPCGAVLLTRRDKPAACPRCGSRMAAVAADDPTPAKGTAARKGALPEDD